MKSGHVARAQLARNHRAATRSLEGRGRFSAGLALIVALVLALSGAELAGAAPTTFVVNDSRDLVDARVGQNGCQTAAGTCTLRAAIQEANATSDADTIQLLAGFFTITIRGSSNTQGDFDVTRPLTIVGAGAGTIVDGGQPPAGSAP